MLNFILLCLAVGILYRRDYEMKWWLAFVIAISYACGKDEVGGKQSEEDAERAAVMSQGSPGENGRDGEDGVTTIEVKDIGERPLEINEWQDPVSHRIWLIGSTGKWDDLFYCTDDFEAPDQLLVMQAAMHGLFTVSKSLSGPVTAWAKEEYSLTHGRLINSSAGQPFADFQGKGIAHGIFCIKKLDAE